MDLFLAVIQRVQIVGVVFAIFLGCWLVWSWLYADIEYMFKEETQRAAKKKVWKRLPWLILFILPSLVPSMDEVWHVRIALIKYQLASPENVSRASETIERIGHKLECKYLGGCEDEK